MSELTVQRMGGGGRPDWRLDWRDPALRRKAGVLFGAGLLHILVLGGLGLGVDRDRTCHDCVAPPIFIEMEPRPLVPGETTRVRSPPASPSSLAAARAPSSTTGSAALASAATSPSPITPHLAAVPPVATSSVPAALNPWSVAPETMADAVARSMRTGVSGCRTMFDRLTSGEQATCLDRQSAVAARAHPIGPRTLNASEQRRESQFAREGATALERYERRVAPLDGRTGINGISPECIGGNLRGTCAGANLDQRYQHSEDQPFGARSGPK